MADADRIRSIPQREPSADLRIFAGFMRQMYVALVQEGFSAAEAMQILGTTIAAQINGGKDGKP